MKYKSWPKRDPIKNYFPVPNEIFDLGLPSGAISVYSYLLRCENRKTYQCWPSYRTIGKSLQMSANTVRKYVLMLEERGLICTEPTKITTKDGRKRNGSLLYTIRPIQEAIDYFHQRQMEQLEESAELHRAAERLAAFERDKQLRTERPA
jgi:DNA-binding transcriptional MocR family regulator